MALETEQMEIVDEEREERLVRKHRKTLEWQTKQTCRKIMMEVVEGAVMESRLRQQTRRDIVVGV